MQMGVGKGKGILNVKMNPLRKQGLQKGNSVMLIYCLDESHDDQAATMANGFKVVARSEQGAVAAIECGARRFYGLQQGRL
ncbi:glutamine-hydrolyzing GMP synthase [Tanacetum coccineum]